RSGRPGFSSPAQLLLAVRFGRGTGSRPGVGLRRRVCSSRRITLGTRKLRVLRSEVSAVLLLLLLRRLLMRETDRHRLAVRGQVLGVRQGDNVVRDLVERRLAVLDDVHALE